MSKKLQRALIEVVVFMAGMLMYQGNVFGTTDLNTLNQRIKDLVDAMDENPDDT